LHVHQLRQLAIADASQRERKELSPSHTDDEVPARVRDNAGPTSRDLNTHAVKRQVARVVQHLAQKHSALSGRRLPRLWTQHRPWYGDEQGNEGANGA